MSSFDFDLFVIGGGSGGVRAARMAAGRGARVALAETLGTDGLGGTCVNVGCIPKKLYSYAAHYADAFEESHGFGWEGEKPVLNWSTLKANRAKEISRLNGVYANLLRGSGVTVINGFARIDGPHALTVATLNADGSPGHQSCTAANILIATGGTPFVPHFTGREHVITSNEVFDLEPFPQRLLVVGGGYIACEFASIFAGLGAQVTQLVRGELPLRGFDADVQAFLALELHKQRIALRARTEPARIEREGQVLRVTLRDGECLEADAVLMATGRRPNTDGLGLAEAGVALDGEGVIVVDAHYDTSVPGIHALGDVIHRVQLTPVALAEAMVLVERLFGGVSRTMDYETIPTAVFTHPNVATVGLTEAQARERHGELRIFRSEFRALKHTLSGSDERTLMKLVVDAASDRVLGLHVVGDDAGEIVQGFAVAMKAGATKAMFDATVGIHPTAAEELVTMREPVA